LNKYEDGGAQRIQSLMTEKHKTFGGANKYDDGQLLEETEIFE